MIEKNCSNYSLVSKRAIEKGLFILLAIISFFPSLAFLLLFLLIFGLVFRSAGLKYLLFFSCFMLLTAISMLFQQDFYYKGFLLSAFFLLPFLLVFIKKKDRNDHYIPFMKAHIYMSLIQIPLQVSQFIAVYGFDFGLLLSNSSSGDASFGSLFNSFVLADKQILSMFFLITLKNHFSTYFFRFGLLVLFFSFLFIGANTTTLVLLLSIVIYYVILSNIELHRLRHLWKRIAIGFLLIFSFFLVNKYIFSSQYAHINNSLYKVIENANIIGKLKAYGTIVEIYSDDPKYLLFGLGSGYYSSRVSFILSGEYLWGGEHSLLGTQNNERFDKHLRPLWNDDIRFNVFYNNTFHQPFSSILTIVSEYGVLVLCFFIVVMFRTYKQIKVDVGKLFVVFAVGMLMLDNFLEYPRIFVPALIFILFLRSPAIPPSDFKKRHPVRFESNTCKTVCS